MILAEMGPNATIERSSDLGNRDMDRNHDWLNDGKQHYDDSDLAGANNFLQQATEYERDNEGNDSHFVDIVDYDSLNEKQQIIFKRIKSHYHNTLTNPQTEPLRIVIIGTAGTGKSYLIMAIRKMLHEMVRHETKTPLLVLAPTGVAAFNIRGRTVHSALSIPIHINDNSLDMNGERLKCLQQRLEGVKYIIIDEKSMVGRRMLALIDMRLRQAFPDHKNEPFGRRSIILFGDFGQLPPVLDLPMYASTQRDALLNDGFADYKQFREVYELDVIQRQSGNSEIQQKFREILLRMRNGESTIEDWKILNSRTEDKQSREERNRFSDATFILPRWIDVEQVNMEKLRSLNRPVAKILAVHTDGRKAKNADSDMAKGLEPQLLLARGARIMLTANL